MGMSSFMARFGGGGTGTVVAPPVVKPSLPATPKTEPHTVQAGMSSFLTKFGRDDNSKKGGFTSRDENDAADERRSAMEGFIQKFGRVTEEYKFEFTDGVTVTIRFDKEEHEYFRIEINPITGEDIWVKIPGVTTVVGIRDKSFALVPWGVDQAIIYAKNKFLELDEATLASIMSDSLVLQDWFYSTMEESKKKWRDMANKASDIGKKAHEWLEEYIKAVISGDPLEVEYVLNNLPEDRRAASCCEAAVAWMRAHNVRWLYTERKVYSKKYDAAGTCDGVCLIDSCADPKCKGCQGRVFKDALSVIDWKSSNALYDYYRHQLAAYVAALIEELGLEIKYYWVIQLGKDDGNFGTMWCVEVEEDYAMDLRCFEACLTLYREVNDAAETLRTRRADKKAVKKAEKEAAELAEKQEREEKKEARRLEKEAERAAIDARKAERAARKAAKEGKSA